MKHQIATNPEQSKRLLACGVDPNTADMYLSINMCPGENYGKYSTRVLGEDLITLPEILRSIDHAPAWSLSALLALHPKEITDDNGNEYHFSLAYERPLCSDYDVSYKPCWFDGDDLIAKHDPSPIEACVQAIEWLTANGYILNTK